MSTVVIAGAGSTGLMLARELRLADVDVVLLDKLPARSGQSRAGGMHPRTLELLDQRGIVAEFLEIGTFRQIGHFSGLPLDFSGFQTRFPHSLMLLQYRIEQVLEARAAELGVTVRWSAEVVGIAQDDAGVTVTVRGADGQEETIAADYLVGCDGGRSAVRKLAGIGFPGTDATMTSLLADVALADPPADMVFDERREHGTFSLIPFEPGWHRVIISSDAEVADRTAPVTLDELRAAFVRVAGTDFGMHGPRWLSRFTDAAHLADDYRRGRVLLAGDAAHIHYPAGGQGLNTGVQDAVNLGWKLALVANGQAPAELLDSYQSERRPAAARVLDNTRAQTALGRPGPHVDALRDVLRQLIDSEGGNDYLGGMISALDLRYAMPTPEDHPLIGRRMPDVDLKTDAGDLRLYTLLHPARPILLGLDPDVFDTIRERPTGWRDRVDLIAAKSDADTWPIAPHGHAPIPAAVLVRPDGYVAWAGDDPATLTAALRTWFGPAN